jgi:3-oxoacyl-[acyl-carrier protein] reductase
VSRSDLTGQVALVTGGAGGIGAAICRALAEEGATVLVGFSTGKDRAERLVAELPGPGLHRTVLTRVDDSATLNAVAESVQLTEGRLDILVNNAGVTTPVPHDDLDSLNDEWIDTIMRINVRGAFACTRAFLPLLRSGGGLVINISSVAAQTGLGSNVAYCASKAALDSMTRSLGRALAPDIRVLSVSPGWVDGEYAQKMPTEAIAVQAARTPLGRIAHPQEVARAVLAAATHLTFTTGCVIPVDGGRPLG